MSPICGGGGVLCRSVGDGRTSTKERENVSICDGTSNASGGRGW